MSCNISGYCISNTSSLYDGNYYSGGTHDGNIFYTGETNSYFIYYSSGSSQWCLSMSLGGSCFLFGPSPSSSNCPDLYDYHMYIGTCSTTTSTSTIDCGTFDFSAIFDCDVIETPTPTPTLTLTPTSSSIPIPNPCSATSVDAILSAVTVSTPTPTKTPTPTPTNIVYNCELSGDVTFNVIDVYIKCPITKEFKDCFNKGGTRYYTNEILYNPSGGEILPGMVFEAIIDGKSKCVGYVGINHDISPSNSISLYTGPWGIYSDSSCNLCYNQPTKTPTQTPTNTPTNTPTQTQTKTPSVTLSQTPTNTTSQTPTQTPTETQTPTPTLTPSQTTTQTQTPTPSITKTKTPTPTLTPSPTKFALFYSSTTCGTNVSNSIWSYSGGKGFFTVDVDTGSLTGLIVLNYDAISIPDKFTVTWNSSLVIDTGFRGSSSYNSQLNSLGYPSVSGPGAGIASFVKTSPSPSIVTVSIIAPLNSTQWNLRLDCPI